MSGWWWALFHVGLAGAIQERDMLARLGGGGLYFLQENPSSLFNEFFKIPFSRFPSSLKTTERSFILVFEFRNPLLLSKQAQ